MKKIKKISKDRQLKSPKRDRELPATKRLLDLTKQELKKDISSLRLEMRGGFKRIEARFIEQDAKMDSGFSKVDARFANVDAHCLKVEARFLEQDAKFDAIQAQLTKMMIILEDQNDRNRVVLDAYTTVYEKFMENDTRVEKLEVRVFGAKQSST